MGLSNAKIAHIYIVRNKKPVSPNRSTVFLIMRQRRHAVTDGRIDICLIYERMSIRALHMKNVRELAGVKTATV